MALRVALVAALALVADAFQAPASAVSRSTQQLPRARFSTVSMVADEVEDKVCLPARRTNGHAPRAVSFPRGHVHECVA